MKVNTKNAPVAQAAGAPSFGQLLAAPPPPPMLVAASARALNLAAKSLAQAAQVAVAGRARVDAEASRLLGVRGLHMVHAEQLVSARTEAAIALPQVMHERALDALSQELLKDLEGTTSRAANDAPGKAFPPPPVASDSTPAVQSAAQFKQQNRTRAAQAMALIEKIELFVRSAERPSLALTLNNSLGARVEIERLGPQEVALRLVGQRGPPSPEAVGRIRDALYARGLRLAAISVA
jgi:hypothetical protein